MIPSERVCSNRLLFDLFKPDKLVRLSQWIHPDLPVRILDFGCGNHSPRYFKTQYPRCRYTGVDRDIFNNTAADMALIDDFRKVDLETWDLEDLPDGSFDLVVLAHVVEHLHRGRELVRLAATKVAAGGTIYVAHPHADSVRFPHRKDTLNFYDDPTHVTVLMDGEVAGLLRALGFVILDHGRTRLARNLALMPVKVVFSPWLGGVTGPMLWDLYGFEQYVVARHPDSPP